MNVTKLMWAFMLLKGDNGEPSYYGSFKPENKTPMVMIKSEGINWKDTGEPYSLTYTEFDGTDCDPAKVEYLVGNLVLKNGHRMKWTARVTLNDFAHCIEKLINEINTNSIYKD